MENLEVRTPPYNMVSNYTKTQVLINKSSGYQTDMFGLKRDEQAKVIL